MILSLSKSVVRACSLPDYHPRSFKSVRDRETFGWRNKISANNPCGGNTRMVNRSVIEGVDSNVFDKWIFHEPKQINPFWKERARNLRSM